MCGRFSQTHDAAAIALAFNLAVERLPAIAPRYNIAPSQPVAVVRRNGRGERELYHLRWGLIPGWAKDPTIGNRLINARAETVAEKPSFRNPLRYRRCLIVADGFYEWQPQKSAGKKAAKQPYYFHLQDHRPFGFAGLWEHWQGPNGEELETCTLLTTRANPDMQPIHDRMPVILEPDAYERWLDPAVNQLQTLQPLLQPLASGELLSYPVGFEVNSPANDSPECLQAMASVRSAVGSQAVDH